MLVTGAGSQTGQAVIKALVKEGIKVCALVHRESQSEQMPAIGAKKVVAGDMRNPCDLQGAMNGIDSVYFICSTANLDERTMGRMAIDAAEKTVCSSWSRWRSAASPLSSVRPRSLQTVSLRAFGPWLR